MVKLKHELASKGEPLITGYAKEALPALFGEYGLKLVHDTSGAECEHVLRVHQRGLSGAVPYAHERTAVVTNIV